MTIRVVKPGFFTTVQDRGRYGFAHLGISPAGAADALSLRIANLLVGNDEYAPALEMTLVGATLEFEESAIVAVSGANFDCRVGPKWLHAHTAIEVPAGAVLQCGSTTDGARSYLAVQGGFDVPLVMGSASTDVRGGFGGFAGRRLQSGDVLEVRKSGASPVRRLHDGVLDTVHPSGPLRVTKGAQHDWFSAETYEKLLSSPYLVSEQSDRAGLRLQGEAISPSDERAIVDRRNSVGRDPGAAGRAADYSVRRSANHRRISQDRQRHRRRHAPHRATPAARPGTVCRSVH